MNFCLEREIPPGDCIFDVITRNQAIEEFKTVVRRLHGMFFLLLLLLFRHTNPIIYYITT